MEIVTRGSGALAGQITTTAWNQYVCNPVDELISGAKLGGSGSVPAAGQLAELAAIVRGERENPKDGYDHDLKVHELTLKACGYEQLA